MVSKIWLSTILCLQVTAHAFVNSPIARSRAVVRADDQQPNPEAPCGSGVTDIASLVKTRPPVYAGRDGNFTFGLAPIDGIDALHIIAGADPSGTGQNFLPMEISASPWLTNPTTILAVAKLPSGMTCTAGNDNQTCLVQLTSIASGSHGCITFSQVNIFGTGKAVQNLAVDPTPSTASGDSTASTSTKITKTHSSTTSAGDLASITDAGIPTSTSKSKRHSATQSGDPSSTDEGGSTTATDAGSPDPTPSAGDPSATDTGGSTDTTPAGDHSTGHTTKYSQTRTAGSSSSTATAKGTSVTARSGSLMARSFSE